MRIIGALLADEVSVVDGKLNITGGMVRYCEPGPDRVAIVNLVVFTEFDAADTDPQLTVEFRTPTGDSQSEQIGMPTAPVAGDVGFASWPLWIPVETDGRYVLTVSGDEGSVSLPLTVHS